MVSFKNLWGFFLQKVFGKKYFLKIVLVPKSTWIDCWGRQR